MSHYTVEELIARWKKGSMTAEQMIGQILQVLRVHEQQIKERGRATATQESEPPRTSRPEQ
jgi:hypothetical protein